MLSRRQSDTIRRNGWFQSLSPDLQDGLLAASTVHQVQARQKLGVQGTVPDSWFCLAGGIVKIAAWSPEGREIVIDLLQPGEWFGGISLLEGLALPYSAETWARSTLLVMTRRALHQAHAEHPSLTSALLRLGWHRGRRIVERTTQAMEGALYVRAQRELGWVFARFGIPSDFGTTLPFRLTQSDLAVLLGASRQRVNEVIGALERNGLLRRGNGGLHWHPAPACPPK